MTTISSPSAATGTAMGAVAAPTVGYLTFVLAMFSGEYFDLNADSDRAGHPDPTIVESFTESLGEFGIGLVGLLATILVATRVWKGLPERLARASLVLGILATIAVSGFWSGWPLIFGAAAVSLAAEARRRIGSLNTSGWIGAILGTLAFLAATAVCVTG